MTDRRRVEEAAEAVAGPGIYLRLLQVLVLVCLTALSVQIWVIHKTIVEQLLVTPLFKLSC